MAALALILGHPALAQDRAVSSVTAAVQTPVLTDAEADTDADDPAINVDAEDEARSFVVTAAKNGGVRVFDLDGTLRQAVLPPTEGSRINNVDVIYGVPMPDGSTSDVVVGADRGLDVIRFWRIDPRASEPLSEITDLEAGRAFPLRQDDEGGADLDNPVDDQSTVYGLSAWADPATGTVWVVGTQRHESRVGFFRVETGEVGVRAVLDHAFQAPVEHKGQDLRQESDEDPAADWSPRFEGTVIDRLTGTVYAGQEDVGLWAGPVAGGDLSLAYETRGAAGSPFSNPGSVIACDVEGLTVHYAAGGTRYLLASSQGGAHGEAPTLAAPPFDDSFVVFRIGRGPGRRRSTFSARSAWRRRSAWRCGGSSRWAPWGRAQRRGGLGQASRSWPSWTGGGPIPAPCADDRAL